MRRGHRIAALVSVLALCPAAAALAAKPKHGARFAGTTSERPIGRFHAPVTFKVAPDGSALFNFTFGSFGCFGSGGPPPKKNPFTGNTLIDAGKVAVSSSGKISQKSLAGYTVAGQHTSFEITVAGHFSKSKKASGTIVFTERVSGGGVNSSCGPATLTWTASAH